jgi:outer membrane murein-binding lipoprotein Lpp
VVDYSVVLLVAVVLLAAVGGGSVWRSRVKRAKAKLAEVSGAVSEVVAAVDDVVDAVAELPSDAKAGAAEKVQKKGRRTHS